MLGRRVAVPAAASALLVAATVSRAAGIDHVIRQRTASGRHATATAYADTGRVEKLAVHVDATPNQRATGFWGWSCKVGVSMSARDADDFARRTPFTVKMRLPNLSTALYTCQVEARARLAGRGRVTVQLLSS